MNDASKWVLNIAGYRQKWQLPSRKFPLKGSTIKIEYPVFNPVLSTIIAISYLDTEEQIIVIPPNKEAAIIPKKQMLSSTNAI